MKCESVNENIKIKSKDKFYELWSQSLSDIDH